MITSSANRHRATGGFTLVEVLISAAIAAFILVAIMTSFLFIGRSGVMLANYTRLEQQARRGLERFAEDTRMASAVDSSGSAWPNEAWPDQVTLTVPHASDSNSNTVTYWWDNVATSPTYHCFMRREVDNTGAVVSTETLISNVSSFQFDRWQAGGATGVQATSDGNTDQLQIHLTISFQGNEYGVASTAISTATNLVVSARYILRNKT